MKLFKILKRIFIVLLVLILSVSAGYTYFISPNDYKFSTYSYTTDKIPSEFDHFKIAFFSDCNISSKDDITRFEKIIKELNNKTFDMVIFGGDLFEDKPLESDTVSKILKSIDCKYGKFAILGEKDIQNEIKITSIFNDGGFEVLKSGIRPLYIQDTSINLIVLDENTDVKKLKLKDKAFTLAISHTPDTFDVIKNKADLQLSGHSYGGLVHIPLIGSMHKDTGCSTYNHGTYYADSSALIVSNGLSGPSSFPYKLGAKNEINIIKLTSQTK